MLYELIKDWVGNDTLEVFGPSGSGKTTFCIIVAKEAVKQGKKVVYVDTERNIPPDVKLEKITYYYRPTLEDLMRTINTLPEADLYILDSIGFPVLGRFAMAPLNERGTMLLKLISIAYRLKELTYKHNALAIVTNQPVSEFGKNVPASELPPFGDKSVFAFKDILRTELKESKPDRTVCSFTAWRSRRFGRGTHLFDIVINDQGVRVRIDDGIRSRYGNTSGGVSNSTKEQKVSRSTGSLFPTNKKDNGAL